MQLMTKYLEEKGNRDNEDKIKESEHNENKQNTETILEEHKTTAKENIYK